MIRRRIRLVATDLDGTIVREDGTVSPRTLTAFDEVMAAGIRVVFVTGRPPRWMSGVTEATGHRGVAVCANGAYVYDLQTEQIVKTFPLDISSALTAAERLQRVLPSPAFAIETADGFGHEPAYEARWKVDPLLSIGPVRELIDRPVAKLLVRDESLDGDRMLTLARPALRDVAEVTHSNVNDCLLEVSALGVSKATTLQKLADSWGIDAAEVVAFGDMPNDLEMLQWAGSGYAMANSHPDVLAAVSLRAPAIHDEGVARVLQTLLACAP